MRSDREINNEIVALKNALQDSGRWNDSAREQIKQTIEVLTKRMSVEDIEATYYIDETSAEYEEGDNDLYFALMRTAAWMLGEADSTAPSSEL